MSENDKRFAQEAIFNILKIDISLKASLPQHGRVLATAIAITSRPAITPHTVSPLLFARHGGGPESLGRASLISSSSSHSSSSRPGLALLVVSAPSPAAGDAEADAPSPGPRKQVACNQTQPALRCARCLIRRRGTRRGVLARTVHSLFVPCPNV